MRVLHLIGRIGVLNRGNIAPVRQIESIYHWASPGRNTIGILKGMIKPAPRLAEIAAQFMRHDIEWSRGAYMIIDRRTANPIARLRPIPDTDRFELFYWSNDKGRWTTFGNLGRMKLMLESAHEIVENDPMFRVPRSR
jgi:hypothetical protein